MLERERDECSECYWQAHVFIINVYIYTIIAHIITPSALDKLLIINGSFGDGVVDD
jgi:hypothetical protein